MSLVTVSKESSYQISERQGSSSSHLGLQENLYQKRNYDGSGVIAKSGLSVTDLDQVYPYDGSGTVSLSGTTTTPYNEAYLPVIKNAFRVKGGDTRLFDVEKIIYNYARSESDVFEKEDNGTITVRRSILR